jgi:hypothetical protein
LATDNDCCGPEVRPRPGRGAARDSRVDRQRLHREFAAITPQLYRYPAIDPDAFARSLVAIAGPPQTG